jgi:hypothetical protein
MSTQSPCTASEVSEAGSRQKLDGGSRGGRGCFRLGDAGSHLLEAFDTLAVRHFGSAHGHRWLPSTNAGLYPYHVADVGCIKVHILPTKPCAIGSSTGSRGSLARAVARSVRRDEFRFSSRRASPCRTDGNSTKARMEIPGILARSRRTAGHSSSTSQMAPLWRTASSIELAAFLSDGSGKPEQQALLRLIGTLVDRPTYAERGDEPSPRTMPSTTS